MKQALEESAKVSNHNQFLSSMKARLIITLSHMWVMYVQFLFNSMISNSFSANEQINNC